MPTKKIDDTVRQTWSVDEAAKILGIGRSETYAAIHRGEVPAIRIGKRLVVPRAALARLMDEGTNAG